MFQILTGSSVEGSIENVKTIAEILGLIIGGLWAYYKFFKGRTFRPRLELSVTGKTWHINRVTHIFASVQIQNVGLSKLELSKEGTGLRVLSQDSTRPDKAAGVVTWKWQMTLPVFERHRWIEPGETISDQNLIALRGEHDSAMKLELRIVSNGIEWNSLSIIEPVVEGDRER